MRLLCLVNHPEEATSGDSTPALLLTALSRGHQVWLAGVADLGLDASDRIFAHAHLLLREEALLRLHPLSPIDLEGMDVVLIRTNPGRDQARGWAHEVAIELTTLAMERGILVLSNPRGLAAAASKLYLTALPPQFRPATVVSRDPDILRAFARSGDGHCVLKPLNGTHGRDVFLVHANDLSNFNQIVDVLTRSGFAMAQRFIPEAQAGDTRLLLLNGEPLLYQGQVAAVRRVPGKSDFRSNIHAGGSPTRAHMTPALTEIARSIGPRLRADGIFLAGLDVIGDKVVEINVFSPGGLGDAGRFAGVDFTIPVIAAIESHLGTHQAA